MASNYVSHLHYERADLVESERTAGREAHQREAVWMRSIARREQSEQVLLQRQTEECRAQESFREAHEVRCNLRREIAEIEEELSDFGESHSN